MSRGALVPSSPRARPPRPGALALARQRKPNLGPRPPGWRAVHLPGRGHRADRRPTAENVDKTARGAARSRRRPRCRRVHAGPPGREPDPRRAARRHQRRGGAGGRGADRSDRQADRPRGRRRPSRARTPSPARRATWCSVRPGRHVIEVGPTALQGEEITGAERRAARAERRAGSSTSTSAARARDAFGELTGKAACDRPATPSAASPSCSTARSSPRPRSTSSAAAAASAAAPPTSPATSPQTEAKDLAALIEGGALPLELEVDLRPPRRPDARRRGDRRLDRGRHHRPDPDRPVHHRSSTASSASLATIALDVLRPAGLRHARSASARR